jgi:hypothetical protein
MKITIELTYKELDLICRMSSTYVDVLDEKIEFNKKCDLSCEWKMGERDKANEFWAKIEKAKNEMITGAE